MSDLCNLIMCISREALDFICGSEHDFDKNLDDTCSGSRRVIDVVIEDLREIEAEVDNLGFIRMVDKI